MEYIFAMKTNPTAAILQRWARRIKMSVGQEKRADLAGLSAHQRRDVGLDDAHCKVRPNPHDPLEIEIRRLNTRL